MTMDWFPWYPADYRLDTAHLTAEQDGIYRRLIDYYMEGRQPLPDNDIALARIAGIGVETWAIAAAIVRPFFCPPKEGKLHHKRCDLELDRQDGLLRKQSEKGKKGAELRWKHKQREQNDSSNSHSNAHGSGYSTGNATETETETIEKKTSKKENPTLPDWVPQQEWDAWLECRKHKKAPNTPHALKLALANLEKLKTAGQNPLAVLNQSIMRGYSGLFEVKQGNGTTSSSVPSAPAHNPHREIA